MFAAFASVPGCASLDRNSLGNGDNPRLTDSGRSIVEVDGGVTDSGAADATLLRSNPLCGGGFCFQKTPDDPNACVEYDGGGTPREPPDASHGVGGAPSRDAGKPPRDAAADASDGNVHADAATTDAGSVRSPARDGGGGDDGRDASAAPDSRDAGSDPTPLPAPAPAEAYSCQVTRDDYGKPVHQCARAGTAGIAASCKSTADCRPGLACVGRDGVGQCFPFCCDPDTTCGRAEGGQSPDSFCSERPLVERHATDTPLRVPVCVPTDQCQLLGGASSCPSGLACTVVRADGTTSCVEPGKGRFGEPCPCAAGYFCSQRQNTCEKICSTADGRDACAPGKCQATAGFPAGFGLCVGPDPATR